ncbi:hypothetical protein PORY_002745 [Pneumocystis oryctolagi]|uniref:Uncharacterized protein n=1 Tax=Pneumocystis oryctolagi TaxID=42067 RepID=A0ACB7C877_9ASCO|nr:hypothetical protein PORY_002745 [Pneumocystis oryctolagi]
MDRNVCSSDNFDMLKPDVKRSLDDMKHGQPFVLTPGTKRQTRTKLEAYNTIQDVVSLIEKSQRILVITGAGISTSLGIPDFRSDTGIYSKLEQYGLSDPQEVFDIDVFKEDPSIFYSFMMDLFPLEKFKNIYSPTHAFIKLLQDKGKLLTQYTQNVDNIEETVGIQSEKLVQCHGSFKNAICILCGYIVSCEIVFNAVQLKVLPLCPKCLKKKKNKKIKIEQKFDDYEFGMDIGILKPNITFFGEKLSKLFDDKIKKDIYSCDLVICIGTSLKVAPVSKIINSIPPNIPQVYISRELVKHIVFDVVLLSDYCDDVIANLCYHLHWNEFYDIAKRGHQDAFNRMKSNIKLIWKKESKSVWRLEKDI